MPDDILYTETHRPQFHFTPKYNWTNDPNGLVYYEGEYHLFFQHNPTGITWGNMTWGHAISTDLVHWTQLKHALHPDELGTIFSGSAVVDWHNSAGFQIGDEKALVVFYTSAGKEPVPFTQSIAYSNDRGRTWTKHENNPVIGHIRAQNRDPKVFWHAPSEQWIMALYLDANDYTIYGSKDLKAWEQLCDLTLPGVTECPDLFELSVDGDRANTRWVYWGANGGYLLGQFDGRNFTAETDVLNAEHGRHGYAAQTWSDTPDGRLLQISWMRGGKYPAMPFNQQMSFPVELSLRTTPAGIRLCREPIAEIGLLHHETYQWDNYTLAPGTDIVPATKSQLFDIRLEIEPNDATSFGVKIRGIDLRYEGGKISFQGTEAPLAPIDGRLVLQLLVDRTSLEIFGHRGELSMSICYLPEAADNPLVFYAEDGVAHIVSLAVHPLRSAWE